MASRSRRSSRVTYVTRPSLPPLEEFVGHLRGIWRSRWLTNDGPIARRFEAALERRFGGPRVSVTTNGTLALQLIYRTVFRTGQRVVTTPFTFAATTTALAWEGLAPEFADIDPETFNLDPSSVAAHLEGGAEGIVGVHVFGNPAGSRELHDLAKRHGASLAFDGAHAFGVRLGSELLFALGNATALSFHATKNFHTFEGGAVLTSDLALHRRLRLLRAFGIPGPDEGPAEPGINAKMTEVQAAMGLANLGYVDRWIRARGERYELYRDLLGSVPSVSFQRLAPCRYNYIYMPILLDSQRSRDRVHRHLVRHGVQPRKYFYPPTHRFPFLGKARRDPCPVATDVARRVLTLPLYPDLSLSEVRRIARLVKQAAS